MKCKKKKITPIAWRAEMEAFLCGGYYRMPREDAISLHCNTSSASNPVALPADLVMLFWSAILHSSQIAISAASTSWSQTALAKCFSNFGLASGVHALHVMFLVGDDPSESTLPMHEGPGENREGWSRRWKVFSWPILNHTLWSESAFGSRMSNR